VFINGRNNFFESGAAAFDLKDVHNKPKTDEDNSTKCTMKLQKRSGRTLSDFAPPYVEAISTIIDEFVR
jgi:hypothetical protein